ncbi:MAG: energy transducer TonB, partial [Polaribacter sp.]|nr:energy transducer TonB [Polaribacter sp.]
TKTQSKKMNQLKYLVLIPVLTSMFFYVACTTEEVKEPMSKEERIKELKAELTALIIEQSHNQEEIVEKQEVSFLNIDKAPTFPGCESGDKDCFSKNIQKHFAMNFDANLMKTLGLEPGRKRVFIGFKIGADGNIVDIKARAPHEKIEKEVIRVMDLLPKVTPGEQDGKAVAVTYSIPFTLVVD